MDKLETDNLTTSLEEQLADDFFAFIKKAGETAHKRQQRLYLVGGAVRDLLLERCTLDIDLVVEGDAIKLAQDLSRNFRAAVVPHSRFGTAKLKWKNRSVDFASARAETYIRPGALPTVRPGTIKDDLARRDFTINAMALELNPAHFGEIIDPYGGRRDIEEEVIRVLHEKSFIDDATRIWRAIRYEQRLDFNIEPKTLKLLQRDIGMLDTISGDRIRHELEIVLKEELPEKILMRADKMGVLAHIHPSLKGNDWLMETFAAACKQCLPDAPCVKLYLGLLFYRLTGEEIEKVISFLKFSKDATQVLRDTASLKAKLGELSVPGLSPSYVYEFLHGYSLTAIEANKLASGSKQAAEHIELYTNVLRHVKPALTGEDLIKMDIPAGPKIKEILQKLREARLDGFIETREEEEAMVRRLKVITD